ncbi:MAG: PHP domain-containing protein [Desulfobacterales bacterium]
MIPLTVRSGYSLMWGTVPVTVLGRHARKLGYTRLALTDTDNLYGLWPFLAACKQEGLRPIVGAEVTAVPTGNAPARRVVCLVKNSKGYENLCRILTLRHTDPDFDLESAVMTRSRGLAILATNPVLLSLFMTPKSMCTRPCPATSLSVTHPLRQAAIRRGIPVVATPGSFFIHPDDFPVHRVLRAIDGNTALSSPQPRRMSRRRMRFVLSGRIPRGRRSALKPLDNTHALSERLTFTGPDFGIVMPPYKTDTADQAAGRLRRAAYKGARMRYGDLSERSSTAWSMNCVSHGHGICRLFPACLRHCFGKSPHLWPGVRGRFSGGLLSGNYQCLSRQAQSLF